MSAAPDEPPDWRPRQLADADRARLLARLPEGAPWLMARILGYADQQGYTRYTSTLLEAWRLSIDGLTEAITGAAARSPRVLELTPDQELANDPATAFGLLEAQRHRARGINLAMFLGLMKYYRETYAEWIAHVGGWADADTVQRFVRRLFDRTELAYSTEWAGEAAELQLKALASANRAMANEKNQYLTLFESLSQPALLTDAAGQPTVLNHAAVVAFGGGEAGPRYYGETQAAPPLPWLTSVLAQPAEGPPLPLTLDTGLGRRQYDAHHHPMLDVSGKFAGYVVLLADVTAHRAAEARAVDEAAHHKALVDRLPAFVYQYEVGFGARYWSPHAQETLGFTEAIRRAAPGAWHDAIHPDDQPRVDAAIAAASRDAPFEVEYRIRDQHGRWRWLLDRSISVDHIGERTVIHGVAFDLTARREAELALEAERDRLTALLRLAPVAIVELSVQAGEARESPPLTPTNWVLTTANEAALRLLDVPAPAALERGLRRHWDLDVVAQLRGLVTRIIGGEALSQAPLTWPDPERESQQLLVSGARLPAPAGEARVVVLLRDVSQERAYEAQLDRLNRFDPLTGLLNRRSVVKHLADRLRSDASRPTAVVVLDLVRFGRVNDSLGHGAGDALLVAVGQRLTRALPNHAIGRLDGDTFAVVLGRLRGPEQVAAWVHRIRERLQAPFAVEAHAISLDAHYGVAIAPADARTAAELMRLAQAALAESRRVDGHGGVRYASPRLGEAARARLERETRLREALGTDEFSVAFQPQFDGRLALVGFEALARWRPDGAANIPPNEFIVMAEDCGLIDALTQRVLSLTMRQVAAWAQAGLTGFRVSINASATELHRADFADRFLQTCAAEGLSADRFEIEITESAVLRDPANARATLDRLAAAGVRVALDDFGTGHSSLANLRRLPLHTLKIDRSFVDDIETDPDDQAICRAVVALGHGLGLEVVAEGVETMGQQSFLLGLGCDVLQGFGPGRPMTGEAATAWLRGDRKPRDTGAPDAG